MSQSPEADLALTTLAARHATPGRLTFFCAMGGVVARLEAPAGTALVALKGAQVLSWQPAGHAEALWRSPSVDLAASRPVRGGAPLCWPWFGAHPTDTTRPSHGVARTAIFDVSDSACEPSVTTLALKLASADGALLTVTIALSDTLTIGLETANAGDRPMDLTAAIHTYFAVTDIAGARVDGLASCHYLDQLTGVINVQSGPVTFEGEVDRVYHPVSGAISIVDPGLSRRLVIESEGSASAVVWNPWEAKAARLGDLGPDGYRRMLCVETANAGADARRLDPGARHRLAAIYRVEPM